MALYLVKHRRNFIFLPFLCLLPFGPKKSANLLNSQSLHSQKIHARTVHFLVNCIRQNSYQQLSHIGIDWRIVLNRILE